MVSVLKKFHNKEFLLRVLSSIVILPFVFFLVWYGGILYKLFLFSCAVLMAFEWKNITKKAKVLWDILGVLLIALPVMFLYEMREFGANIIFWLIIVIAATDVFAYFGGKIIGGPKILPKISPKKTWAGLVSGMIFAFIIGNYCANLLGGEGESYIIFPLFIALFAQIGDFLESWVKRSFNVKDSGNLIPGHGGILDRVDGYIFTAPMLYFYYLYFI